MKEIKQSGLRSHHLDFAKLYLLLQDVELECSLDLRNIIKDVDKDICSSKVDRWFFTSGPIKPKSLFAFAKYFFRYTNKRNGFPKLIILIDGLGHYSPPKWRKSRVAHERRFYGIKRILFYVVWDLRNFILLVLSALGVVRQVDIWFELGKLNTYISCGSKNKKRVLIGQPLVEDFDLNEKEVEYIERKIHDSKIDLYIPHPRSNRHPDISGNLNNSDGSAELEIIKRNYFPVSFCSSTVFNLELLGEEVEFLTIPPELLSLNQHYNELCLAQQRRIAALKKRST